MWHYWATVGPDKKNALRKIIQWWKHFEKYHGIVWLKHKYFIRLQGTANNIMTSTLEKHFSEIASAFHN